MVVIRTRMPFPERISLAWFVTKSYARDTARTTRRRARVIWDLLRGRGKGWAAR